jgi:hypothetical protein
VKGDGVEDEATTMKVARITFGVMGTRPDGSMIEAVIVEYSLASGLHSSDDWEMNEADRAMASRLATYVEERIAELRAGNQEFRPTAETIGFTPDKRGETFP